MIGNPSLNHRYRKGFYSLFKTLQQNRHVGIYVNETTMFDANSSGVGYHTWNTGYWSQHRPSIRRVITK
ncbi:C40 family peptidase [Enterococcus faecalis]|uniref:NlpC/P60 family protein n=1 Tax=Enterococcus faecalis TaxID=1351 RepID=UPI002A366D6D|nr:NlpC/P60 family protein [Enterococcus faecalis]MCD5183557.1 C40 family peptidase [Enterococcus faecalis]